MPVHGGNCSGKAKHDISGNHYPDSGSKTVERRSSGSIQRREEATSKGSSDEKSSRGSPSKLKKQLMSPSRGFAEQKERYALKKRSRVEEPPRTGKDSSTFKTREPSKSSTASKDSPRQNRRELVKDTGQRHQEFKFKDTKLSWTEVKGPSASPTKQSSTSAKHTTSDSSSHAVKNITFIQGNVKSVSDNTPKSSSTQQQVSPLRFTFKIPKKVHPRPVESTSKKNEANSTNKTVKHGTEVSKSVATVSNSKQKTVQQPHSCLDVTPSFSSEGQDKRSSLSGELPATSDTHSEPWYDQVMKNILR